jgi:hypothetical protein
MHDIRIKLITLLSDVKHCNFYGRSAGGLAQLCLYYYSKNVVSQSSLTYRKWSALCSLMRTPQKITELLERKWF